MKRVQLALLLAANLLTFGISWAAPSAVLVRVKGKVEVQRGAQKLVGRDGLALQKGDKVSVSGGTATIYALDGPPKTLQSGSLTVGVAAAKAGSTALWKGVYDGMQRGLNRNDRRVALTMRPGQIEIISPLPALIDTPRPRFEWLPGALDAARYEVVITNSAKQVVWRGQTDKSALEYPAEAPALTGKGALSWSVSPLRFDNNTWKPIEGWNSRVTTFQVASATQLQTIKNQLDGIDTQLKAAPKAERLLARAALWSAQGFNAKALQELETAGDDATVAEFRRALWQETGQAWRLKAEQKAEVLPIGNADPKILAFKPDSQLVLTDFKDYVAPAGRFSLRIPSRFGVASALLPKDVAFFDFGATETSSIRLSLTVASEANFPEAGSLMDNIATISKTVSDFKVDKPTPTTFRNQKALSYRWTATRDKVPCSGQAIEWREDGAVWVAGWGGDANNTEVLRPLFDTLEIGSNQPRAKAHPPVPPEDIVTFQGRLLKQMEDSTSEMARINKQAEQRNVSVPPTATTPPTEADFEALDKARLATPADTYERATAALEAARMAARLAWVSSEKSDVAASNRWFGLRSTLEDENYKSYVAATRADLKTYQTKIDELTGITPPLASTFAYHIALEGLLMVKNMYLNELNSMALNRGDIKNLELTYRQIFEGNQSRLEFAKLKNDDQATLLDRTRSVAMDFDNLAYAAQKRADLDGARAYNIAALSWRRSIPDTYSRRGLDDTLRYRGDIEAALGDNRVARDYFEQSLKELDRIQPSREKEIDAEENEQMRSIARVQVAQNRALLLNNLSLVIWTLGDLETSKGYLEKALAAIEPLPKEGFPGSIRAYQQATTLNNLAVYYADTGDMAKASDLLGQSMQLNRDWGEDGSFSVSLLNSAALDYDRGLKQEALAKATTARTIFVQLQRPVDIVKCDVFAAKLQFQLGKKPEALTLANNALTLARTAGDAEWLAAALRIVAKIRLEMATAPLSAADKTQITALIDEAARTDSKAGDVLSEITTLSIRAALLEKSGDLNGALTTLKAAIARNEGVRATTSSATFSEVKSNYEPYERAVELLLKLNRPEEAFDMMGRARSKKLVDSLSLTALQSNDPALQKLLDRSAALDQKIQKTRAQLAAEVAQPAEQRDAVKITHLQDLIASTQAEFFDVSTQIKAKNPRFDKALSLSPRELKKAQRAIPEGTVLLQYAPLDDGLYVFAVTRDSLKIYSPKVTKTELSSTVRAYRAAIDTDIAHIEKGEPISSIDSDSPLRQATEKLSKYLLEPVQDEIDAAKTVAIIPSGELFYVPFHALGHTDKAGKWRFLVEDKPLAYLMSGDVLSIATDRDEAQEGQGVLAMGDPTGANLPAARSEVESIARIFPASRALVGGDASKTTLLLPTNLNKRVLHLAAHGVLDSAQPDQSFIQLSPSGKDDGKLRVGEIYGLNLNHVDLVTLSACRTAIGEGEPDGTEISSLAQSFSTAGTPSVVASLWNVEDGSTAKLMEKFYGGITDGLPKGLALQKAQIALIGDAKTRHPIYWAPFELLGDWR